MPLRHCAVAPLRLFSFHKFKLIPISSITFELKKQIYFFLFASDKKISFGNFGDQRSEIRDRESEERRA
jgi:hypothetical protein